MHFGFAVHACCRLVACMLHACPTCCMHVACMLPRHVAMGMVVLFCVDRYCAAYRIPDAEAYVRTLSTNRRFFAGLPELLAVQSFARLELKVSRKQATHMAGQRVWQHGLAGLVT